METRNESRKEYVVLEPKVKRKAQEGYYERRSYSQPWEKIECKKPAKREVTSEVTKAQNSRLAEASKRAKEELADAEKRAYTKKISESDRKSESELIFQIIK